MRVPLLIGSILIASVPAPGLAQGLIATRQQSIDTGGPLPLAIDGERMAFQGATFVRDGSRWLPSDPLISQTISVAADGGRFVNGNPLGNYAGTFMAGVARVQSRSSAGWVLEAMLLPSDLREQLRFGADVKISGDTIAVLADGWRPVGQPPSESVGAVYIFRDTAAGWVEEAILSPVRPDTFDSGSAQDFMALDGDTLAVGGRATVTGTPGVGTVPAVHVFQRSGAGWSQVTKFLFPNGSDGGGFYVAVQEEAPGVSASIIVRGAMSKIFTGHGANWQGQDLAPGTSGPAAFSGSLLAVSNRYGHAPGVGSAGSVQLYQRHASGVWQYRGRVYSSDPQSYHRFGEDLAFDGEWLAVGSRGMGSMFPLDLAVDLFRVLPVGPTEYCTGLPNSTGEVARMTSTGSTSVSANDLELVAGPVPSVPGLFYYGSSQVQLPFGDGFRCVGSGGAGTYRLPQGFAPTGLLTHELDLGASPGLAGQILPGSTWNFQAWYRDPAAGGTGFNLSTGLELSFTP